MSRVRIVKPYAHLNLNVRGLPTSATLSINEKCNQMIAQGRTIYKLGLGQSPFPVPDRVVEALKENAHQKDYLPVMGLKQLREAVAGYNMRVQRLSTMPEDIMVGPGSKELIFILQLVYYGDLIIPTPSWVSYSPQARIIGRHVQWVPTSKENDYRLSPEKLEMICRTDPDRPRVVILNYPSNPTGSTYPIERLKQVARIARKYRVVLVSDEIYGMIHHKGQHISVARYYPEGTIVSGGLSKWCGAGGWRLGTFSFPSGLKWLKEAMATVASETFTATAAPIQYAAVEAFNGGPDIDHYLHHSRRILKFLAKHISGVLHQLNISFPAPQGAFYFFPDFGYYSEKLQEKGIFTSVEFCNSLLNETGIAMLPGSDFGRQPEELTCRMAYVNFSGKEALQASMEEYREKPLDEHFIREFCPGIWNSMEILGNWLNDL